MAGSTISAGNGIESMTRTGRPPLSGSMKRLRIASAIFASIGWSAGMVAVSVWYWPNVTTVPRPESGNLFPANMHGTPVYFTQTELWIKDWLGWIGITLFFVGVLLDRHLAAMRKRAELESLRMRIKQGESQGPL
jgi:hypothetical protein